VTRYCVIGAGSAGLAAIHALVDAGHEVVCFEASEGVGGHWRSDYDALHLITSSRISGFPGFPMPDDYPLFPSRQQVVDYFESFARQFALGRRIRFGTRVLSVTPAPTAGTAGSAGWRVITDAGDDDLFDGVLVANGHLSKQRIPAIAGTFTGKQLHSGSYTDSRDVEGTRVLVVGSGNSGCDLAAECAQARLDVTMSIRRGHYFLPKTFFGRPRAALGFLKEFSIEEQDLLTRLLIRMSVGTYEDYPGLPAPAAERLADHPPVVNNLVLYWIQHGRIHPAPGLERFDGRTVHFTDGSSAEFDTVLWATGFDVHLPFLDPELFEWENGAPRRYGAAIVPVGLEKLYFIGLIAPRGPQAPVYRQQTELVMRMIAAHENAPGQSAPIAAALTARLEPETGIDMLPHLWLEELDRTSDALRSFIVDNGGVRQL
jgi:cation diffusion facilitator CzcD-associated flavoprotein CzcO